MPVSLMVNVPGDISAADYVPGSKSCEMTTSVEIRR